MGGVTCCWAPTTTSTWPTTPTSSPAPLPRRSSGAPVAERAALAGAHGARLLLDESHALGVLGPGGAGLAAALGLADRVSLRIATLSKALGSAGGFVAAAADVVHLLRHRARGFVF